MRGTALIGAPRGSAAPALVIGVCNTHSGVDYQGGRVEAQVERAALLAASVANAPALSMPWPINGVLKMCHCSICMNE